MNEPHETALLIDIEPIEPCKHPIDKLIKITKDINCCDGCRAVVEKYGESYFSCECGAKLKPMAYKV